MLLSNHFVCVKKQQVKNNKNNKKEAAGGSQTKISFFTIGPINKKSSRGIIRTSPSIVLDPRT
jgi:hypothetical protein